MEKGSDGVESVLLYLEARGFLANTYTWAYDSNYIWASLCKARFRGYGHARRQSRKKCLLWCPASRWRIGRELNNYLTALKRVDSRYLLGFEIGYGVRPQFCGSHFAASPQSLPCQQSGSMITVITQLKDSASDSQPQNPKKIWGFVLLQADAGLLK